MTRWLIAACLACSAAGASAQAFPSRAIHFAVAFSPGGIADTIAR
jgi:tripartite-type tricarboxylate transporter receptor subunit TctC